MLRCLTLLSATCSPWAGQRQARTFALGLPVRGDDRRGAVRQCLPGLPHAGCDRRQRCRHLSLARRQQESRNPAGYPIFLVVNGRRGMPAFGDMMTDGQVAAVVNYLRTHFGNNYQDAVTTRDVQDARR